MAVLSPHVRFWGMNGSLGIAGHRVLASPLHEDPKDHRALQDVKPCHRYRGFRQTNLGTARARAFLILPLLFLIYAWRSPQHEMTKR